MNTQPQADESESVFNPDSDSVQIKLRNGKSRRRRILEFMWFMLPFLRPNHEYARRFRGKLGWNKMLVGKSETLHSLSFKSSNWIELKGFEMLCGDFSYKITYTVTRGQGVMGKRVAKGSGFVKSASLLNPIQKVTFTTGKRLEPSQWYTINVVMDIHEYDMNLITSTGSDGVSMVETDCGVVIEYCAGLESCERTTTKSGQIAGILFSRLNQQDELFYTQEKLRRRSRASVSSQVESAVGSEDEIELPAVLKGMAPASELTMNEPVVTEKLNEGQIEACAVYPVSPAVHPSTPLKINDENLHNMSSSNNIPNFQSGLQQGGPFFHMQQPVLKPLLISQRPSVAPSVLPLQPTVQSLTPVMRTEDILKHYMHPYDRK